MKLVILRFVLALVLATPISGPACRYTPPSEARAMLEPTALQMLRTVAPLLCESARVGMPSRTEASTAILSCMPASSVQSDRCTT